MTLHLSIRLRSAILVGLLAAILPGLMALPLGAQELDTSSVDWSLPTGNETLGNPAEGTPNPNGANPNSLALPQSPPPAYQKGFQFKNLFKKKEPPIDVDKLMQVGPRQYADTTGSLLRIITPVCLNGITLPPGIYLTQLQRGATSGTSTAIISQTGRVLVMLPLTGQPFATDSTAATAPVVSLQDDQLLIHDNTHVWVADFPVCGATSY